MLSLQAIISQRRIPAQIIEFASPLPTVELAAQAAGVAPEVIVKTLILHDGNGYYVALVLAGNQRIDFNKVQQFVSAKKLKFAPHADVLRVTGYPAGGTPPFGFDRPLLTLVDWSVLRQQYVMAGGGKAELLVKLTPAALVEAAQATVGDFAQRLEGTENIA
jgi:Cys-tRNA(Pro)/Cys-tRNA(Cys) deacylase